MIDYRGYTIAESHYGDFQLRHNEEIMVFQSLKAAQTFVDWCYQAKPETSKEPHLCLVYNLEHYKKGRTDGQH